MTRQIHLSLLSQLLIVFVTCTTQVRADEGTRGLHAMVVTAHPLATRVGVQILKRGGNAVDAAVAVQFALAVVYPNAGNIGGGGFMVWRGHNGDCSALEFRESAPALASTNMYLDSSGNVVPNLSLDGHLAVGVPGSVAGMMEAHRRYAKLPWRELLQPAIKLARKGFRITRKQADDLNFFQAPLTMWNPAGCALVKTIAWREGQLLRQPELAKTLERIRDHGRDGFYRGETARLIVEEMKRSGGIISLLDLESYHAIWRPPLIQSFNNCRIVSMPPPSSGGIALLQLLTMWEQHSTPVPTFHSVGAVHLIAECERRVYADRSEWLGDPDFVHVPLTGLLSTKYLDDRMKSFRSDSVTPSSVMSPGKASAFESEQTTHFSIVDAEGNAVALTTTLNASYGSKIVVRGAGFLLNNEMDDFSSKPGTPNLYGLVGKQANAIAPGKRMLSSMTPTIVERDGKLLMVVGTPGGSTIMTSVFQTIINVLDYKMNMQDAINARRFHHQWLPDEIVVEEGCLEQSVMSQLTSMGHTFKQRQAIGRVDAILVHDENYLEGGADTRGDDSADGY